MSAWDEDEAFALEQLRIRRARRGAVKFMAAIGGLMLVVGVGAWAGEAHADPNTQTVLPADGVQSITRDGDLWTATTDGIPSEVKLLSPRNEVLCGVNYGIPCSTVTTFTSTGDCAFIQVDGLPGFNSSDPYICLGGTPSTTSNPTSIPSGTPETSPTPTSTPTTTSPAVPPPTTPTTTTPATAEPSPSPTPTSSPTSTPEPSSTTPDASTVSPKLTPSTDRFSSEYAAPRLADTGTNIWGLGLVMFLSMTLGLGALFIARRAL